MPDSFPRLTLAALTHLSGIQEPGKPAIWSTHDIARSLLSQPDRLIEEDDEYGGVRFLESELPEPRTPSVPPVYTKEEIERRDQFFRIRAGQPFTMQFAELPRTPRV